ncbi:MAG TPA: hypothetical protein PKA88_00260 [Polyangiaceae bacterium]|nr:hypothetical protein [Polyangiaceae bacterium]
MNRFSALGLFSALVVSSAIACSSDSDSGGKPGSGGSGGGAGTSACKLTADACSVAGPSGPGNECLARADYSGADKTALRVASHQVKSPTTLAAPFMQDAIITQKSALFEPECNQLGTGQFNLLMQLDESTKELTVSGGVPQKLVGSAKDGSCFVKVTDPNSGLKVEPVTGTYAVGADGKFEATLPLFVMPIYLEDKADLDSVVLMPLHEMKVTGTLSADKNCVGRYADERVNAGLQCQANESEFSWDPAGTYEGYITVEEADEVFVFSLGQTLCVVMTGDPKKWEGPKPDSNCATSQGFQDSGALPKGDWCSTTNSAGGCQDSWRVVIDFAAHAVKIGGEYGNGCP